MSEISLTRSGPPETILPPAPADAVAQLAQALLAPITRPAVCEVLASHPTFLDGWARLGQLSPEVIDGYAAFRVGYHRGLDQLRASGWRGSGYVRWRHESNRGFLRSLHGLAETAAAIGEDHEADRCRIFLHQLDPDWSKVDLDDITVRHVGPHA